MCAAAAALLLAGCDGTGDTLTVEHEDGGAQACDAGADADPNAGEDCAAGADE